MMGVYLNSAQRINFKIHSPKAQTFTGTEIISQLLCKGCHSIRFFSSGVFCGILYYPGSTVPLIFAFYAYLRRQVLP